MDIAVSLTIAIAFAFACRTPLMKAPWAFYVLAMAIDVAFLVQGQSYATSGWWRTLLPFIQRGMLAFSLFSVVMYIGVLPPQSKVRHYLAPIRGPLSILAAILAYAHIVRYLAGYLGRLLQGFSGMAESTVASFAVSFILLALMTFLTVISFDAVRSHLPAAAWKRLQRLAYAFYGLVIVHAAFLLGPSALQGGDALPRLIIYLGVGLAYAILRIWRARSTSAIATRSDCPQP